MILFDPRTSSFPQKCVVCVSGRGSNLKALIDRLDPQLARIVGVYCSDEGQPAEQIALSNHIPVKVAPQGFHKLALDERDTRMVEDIKAWKPDWIVLAGYRRMIGRQLLQCFPNRVVNIHPSLLPAFPGLHAHRDVLDAGAKMTGATIHFVDDRMDHGAIISQASVPVEVADTVETLSNRVLAEEHRLYASTLNELFKKGCRLDGPRVKFGV